MTPRTFLGFAGSLLAVVTLLGTAASAQSEVGTVASVSGSVDVQRGGRGDWQPVLVGAPLFVSDRVRTSASAAAKLIFLDDSVVDLAEHTHIGIERYATDPAVEENRSLLRLASGTLRAIVGDAGGARSRYEVETPTAVARVQRAAFIVHYYVEEEYTDVIGLEREVQVQGTIGVIGAGVTVGVQESTRVYKGRFPAPPEAVTAERFAEIREEIETIGTGSRESLDVGHPLAVGRLQRSEDRPEAVAEARTAVQESGGSFLDPAPPVETLMERFVPDVRANTQPIPEFRAVPPGEIPDGRK